MGKDPTQQTGSTLFNVLHDPANPEAWGSFVARYGPQILRWCRQWKLQDADAHDVTQTVLTKLVQHLRTGYDPDKGSFRSWLKTVAHHAWCDFLKDKERRVAGSGDTQVLERLQAVQAGEDLVQELEEEFRREVLEAAQRQVELQVSSRDWKIFQELTLRGRPGEAVAAECGMTRTAVYMAKSRVQKKLQEAVRRLEEPRPRPPEVKP